MMHPRSLKWIVAIVVVVVFLSLGNASKSGLTLYIKRRFANSYLGFSLHNDLFLVKGGNIHHDYNKLSKHDLPFGLKRIEMTWAAFNYPVNYSIWMSTSDSKIMSTPKVSPIPQKGKVSRGGSFQMSLPCTGLVGGIVRVNFVLNYTKRGGNDDGLEGSTNKLQLSFTVQCNKTIKENNNETTEKKTVNRAVVVTVSAVAACVVVVVVAVIFFWRFVKRIRKKFGFDISNERFAPLEEVSCDSSSISVSRSSLPTVVYSPKRERSRTKVYTKIAKCEERTEGEPLTNSNERPRSCSTHTESAVSTITGSDGPFSPDNRNRTVFSQFNMEDDVFEQPSSALLQNAENSSMAAPTPPVVAKEEDKRQMYLTLNEYWTTELGDCVKTLEDIEICQDVIGEGIFSRVYRGKILQPPCIDVACKVCKEDIEFEQMVSCVNEAILMKGLIHENLLNLIAVVLQPSCPPQILTPLMSHGDLHKFLRHSRGIGIRRQLIGSKQLVNFGSQVASGMEYLASQKIVHRDLSARNCFVDDDLTVKIGDFGLARKLHQFDMYKMEKPGQLAVKWLAIESLMYYIFTEKSDIWSFGILLWELVTLGSQPYAGLDNYEVIPYLETGKRLSRPLRCPDDLFAIMYSCWLPAPEERPSFTILMHKLQDYEQRLRPSCIAFEFDEDTIEMADDCELY